jgi:exodeoxyribonuclease V gamma subunit
VRHPLQGFSPRYFDGQDSRLYSYATDQLAGARSLRKERAAAPPLFDAALPAPEPSEARTLGMNELVRFFEGPIVWLLNRRLAVSLREREVDVPDREPCELRGLDKWGVATRLLELELSDEAGDGYQLARAAGQLPPGTAGLCAYEGVEREVRIVEELVRAARGPERVETLSVHRVLPGGVRLSGELSSRWSRGLVLHHYSRIRGKYVLAAWIKHLVLCWCGVPGEPRTTTLIARSRDTSKRPEHWRFDPVNAAESELVRLVELFDAGQSRPLLLLPSASLAYARARHQGQGQTDALRAARSDWNDGHRRRDKPAGEGDDPHYRRVFGEDWSPGMLPPFAVDGPSFEELAERIFEPLLAHVERTR